jgi:hypothetical protein
MPRLPLWAPLPTMSADSNDQPASPGFTEFLGDFDFAYGNPLGDLWNANQGAWSREFFFLQG